MMLSPSGGEADSQTNSSKPDVDELLHCMAHDYSKLVQINTDKERDGVLESIEDMLTRLEEFGNLLYLVRDDSVTCLNKRIPEICTKAQEIRGVFSRIDKLEEMVKRAKADVEMLESHLSAAESAVGSSSSIRAVLKPLLLKMGSGGSSGRRSLQTPTYEVPPLFSTVEYFPPTPQEPDETTEGS